MGGRGLRRISGWWLGLLLVSGSLTVSGDLADLGPLYTGRDRQEVFIIIVGELL